MSNSLPWIQHVSSFKKYKQKEDLIKYSSLQSDQIIVLKIEVRKIYFFPLIGLLRFSLARVRTVFTFA